MAEHQTRNPDHQKRHNPPGVEKPYNNDQALIDDVKGALMAGTESAGIDVKVSAEDGIIRLYGVVDVLSHKTAAEEIARRIPGVVKVENDLTVANEETFSDKDMYERITSRLSNRQELMNMGVRVHKGVVTLVGHAGSHDDIRSAMELISDTPGVREVKVQRVKVGEGEKEDDADVSRAAERLLDKMGYDHTLFQVYSDAGVLFVKGFVHTREDRARLKTELHKISGVDKLETLLITDDQFGGEIH
ncbi:MAG TPA: BON domain-containing protein [Symbiobacteriaceae bacterium]|nr:BON domain-containing protein [Symbiobacteriaceae bacterium]